VSFKQHSTLMLRPKDSSLKCEASLKIAPPHLIFVLFLALLGTCVRIYFDLLGVLGAVTEKSATRRNNCQSACNFHNLVDNTKCTLKKTQLPWKIWRMLDRCANPPDGLASNNAWCIYGWDETVGTVTQAKDNPSKSPLHRSEQQNFWSSRQLPVLRQGITRSPYASRIPAT